MGRWERILFPGNREWACSQAEGDVLEIAAGTAARVHEISDGQMVSATVDGIELLVANVGGEYRSIGDVCTHAQCSLAEGEIEDGTVICPCHGSVFDLRSGEVLESPATEGEPVYQARVEGDEIQVAKPGT